MMKHLTWALRSIGVVILHLGIELIKLRYLGHGALAKKINC